MVVRHDHAAHAGLGAQQRVAAAHHPLDDERQFGGLDKGAQLRHRLGRHHLPQHHIGPPTAVKRVIDIHAHRQRAALLGMRNLAEDHLVVGVRLDDLDRARAGGRDRGEFGRVAHAGPHHRLGCLRAARQFDHAVRVAIVQVRQRGGHDRGGKLLAVQCQRR